MVIDASAAVAWSVPSQQTPKALALVLRRDAAFVAPWYFGVEFRNAMLKAERRGLIALEPSESSVADILLLVELASPPPVDALDTIQRLARSWGLSHYDAHYLDLALTRSLPLASRDGALLDAARRLGVDAVDLRG